MYSCVLKYTVFIFTVLSTNFICGFTQECSDPVVCQRDIIGELKLVKDDVRVIIHQLNSTRNVNRSPANHKNGSNHHGQIEVELAQITSRLSSITESLHTFNLKDEEIKRNVARHVHFMNSIQNFFARPLVESYCVNNQCDTLCGYYYSEGLTMAREVPLLQNQKKALIYFGFGLAPRLCCVSGKISVVNGEIHCDGFSVGDSNFRRSHYIDSQHVVYIPDNYYF